MNEGLMVAKDETHDGFVPPAPLIAAMAKVHGGSRD